MRAHEPSEPRLAMLRNVVHVNLNVADLDRSLHFYQKLGFEVMHVFGDGPRGESATRDTREVMQFGGRRSRGAVLTLGDEPWQSTKLELIEWIEPRTAPQPLRPDHMAGVGRLAIRTKHLHQTVEKLRADGIEFLSEPVEIDMVGAKRFVLLRDPDGTLLELIEF